MGVVAGWGRGDVAGADAALGAEGGHGRAASGLCLAGGSAYEVDVTEPRARPVCALSPLP